VETPGRGVFKCQERHEVPEKGSVVGAGGPSRSTWTPGALQAPSPQVGWAGPVWESWRPQKSPGLRVGVPRASRVLDVGLVRVGGARASGEMWCVAAAPGPTWMKGRSDSITEDATPVQEDQALSKGMSSSRGQT
jgi:hypothetical protein